ncbi:MAG: glycosyl transferase family protein [Elusimicrobia bacterium]|nr:MAG: glycosyl transferase family protein [Elusimicrobiota bacterium]
MLSICIATYNRAGFIGETLDSILPQLEEDVEIVVVDGASTDNTEAVMREYALKDARVRYIRRPVKGGVDQDYDHSVELARGEYCWFFTDDDLLRPGAVAAVKKAVAQGHDLVIVNAELRGLDLSSVTQHQRMNMRADRVYPPGCMDAILRDAAICLSFIGAVVIRRSLWLARDRKTYYGTEFIHMGVIFQESLPKSVLVIADTHIIIRLGNSHWMPRAFDIWMFKWPKLIWSLKSVSDEAKNSVTRMEPWRNFKNLVFHRSLGGYDFQAYSKYFGVRNAGALWRSVAWLIACSPRWLIVPLHSLYSGLKRVLHHAVFRMRQTAG